VVVDACVIQALVEQLSDVLAGTQDVSNDQLEGQGLGNILHPLGNIDGGVIRLCEEQRHYDGRGMPSVGQLASGCVQIGLCKVEVRRHRRDLCLLGDGSHEPLDTETALGVSAAVREPDDREVVMTQLGQRVSRCAVWALQRGQNFFSSRRSGSLRRFFLVM
jgi:hypothetical protein